MAIKTAGRAEPYVRLIVIEVAMEVRRVLDDDGEGGAVLSLVPPRPLFPWKVKERGRWWGPLQLHWRPFFQVAHRSARSRCRLRRTR